MANPQPNLGEAAAVYALKGWSVFPLHGISTDGRCTCGKPECESPGKHPRTARGFHDATTDVAKIEAWWHKWLAANIGVATGVQSGIFALDVDSRQAAEALKAEGRPIPEGALIQSTGRGWQVIFSHPGFKVKNSSGELAPDIDVRGDGGYIVAPPSRHANGKVYTWKAGEEPGDAPKWLIDLLQQNGRPNGVTSQDTVPKALQTVSNPPATERARAYVTAALEAEWAKVREARKGSRNARLNGAAFALGQLAGVGLSIDEAQSALVSAAIVAGLSEEEAERTFTSGWEAGGLNPRELPVDLGRPEQPDRITERPPEDREKPGRRLEVLTARELLTMTPERPEWIAEPLVARYCISDLVAGPKVGKSTLALALAAAVVTGQPFLGKPTIRTRVLYLTEERGPTFRAALDRVQITSEDFGVILRQAGAGWKWPDLVEAATAEALERGAALLIVDSLADWAALQGDAENSSGAVMEALRPIQAAAVSGLAVLLVRHDRKGPAAELGEAGRGSNATAGACDILMSLRKSLGAGHENRRRLDYLARFDGLPPSQVIEWRPQERRYVLLGTEADIERRACRESLLLMLPVDEPATEKELLAAYGDEERPPRATLQRALEDLRNAGLVERFTRSGGEKAKRGDPYRYLRKADDDAAG